MTPLGARGDDGFTLIELVMALTVLAIAIFGVATVFAASVRTGAADVHRTNAVALATQWRERMAVIPYDQLGQQTGSTPACRTGNVVSGDQPPSDTPPASAVGGVVYTVNLCVVQPPTPTKSDAYKQTTVEVTWSDDTGAHAVWQDSAVYPNQHTQFDPTASSTTLATSSTCSVHPWPAGSPLVLPTAVQRDDSGQLPQSAVTLSAIAGGPCSDLKVVYQPTAGSSVTVSIGTVANGDAVQTQVPVAIAETWDLGLHTITVLDGSAQVAQGTVCVLSSTSEASQC